jgi:hypothetical protein
MITSYSVIIFPAHGFADFQSSEGMYHVNHGFARQHCVSRETVCHLITLSRVSRESSLADAKPRKYRAENILRADLACNSADFL